MTGVYTYTSTPSKDVCSTYVVMIEDSEEYGKMEVCTVITGFILTNYSFSTSVCVCRGGGQGGYGLINIKHYFDDNFLRKCLTE